MKIISKNIFYFMSLSNYMAGISCPRANLESFSRGQPHSLDFNPFRYFISN